MIHVTKDRQGKRLHCAPVTVVDRECVWLRCFNPHDCGFTDSRGRWARHGYCLTNWNRGCPESYHYRACCENPAFNWNRKAGRTKHCQSCGLAVPVNVARELSKQSENEA